MNIGCASRGPTIHVACGDPTVVVLLPLCCCGRCTYSLLCVRTLREGCRHDGPLSPYVHAVSLVCRSCLLLPPPSVCWCCGRAVCVCVSCVVFAVAAGGVCYCAVSLLLLPLCVDGELVCAEGYTQVTGVMAMMMTGRVLLVCALCVLWCGAGGGDAFNFGDDDPRNEYYYGAYGVYCNQSALNATFCADKIKAAKSKRHAFALQAGDSQTSEVSEHSSAGGSSGGVLDPSLTESGSSRPGGTGGTEELNQTREDETAPPPPPPPPPQQ
ncbi:trans-sialidase, putative, partial [Trypanosoma cruzi marinkellei]